MENQSTLKQKIENISKIFDINKVLNLKTDKKYIQKYYSINKIPYSLFHTKTDLMYMGVSRDGIYKEDDLLEAARTVEKYLKKIKGTAVLELATGRGASSFHVAKNFPNVKFHGVDISKGQLDFAFKKAKKINNYYPAFGDYHDLSQFKNETFELVFVIEALCYSVNKDKVLKEVSRILKKDGVFIIFDGYLNKNQYQLTSDEKIATQLAEKGMAMDKFETYESFKEKIKKTNFNVDFEENVSQFTTPTMKRFEKKATLFFKYPHIAKIISKFLPKEFIYNTISGYLSCTLMQMKTYNYMITILKKTDKN